MIDKLKVARSFSRSALSYDSVAYLQREVGLNLLDYLKPSIENKNQVNCVVDLGCGTGFFRNQLGELFSSCDYLGIDIAEGMLRYCQESLPKKEKEQEKGKYTFVCADAEILPLKELSVDCFFSNMALQWCDDLHSLLSGLNRALKPQGLIAMTTLGPNTLCELKQAWSKVDDLVHVNRFNDDQQWRNSIEANGFVVESHHKQNIVLQFSSVIELLTELKLLGAHNINDGQRKSLTSPSRIKSLKKHYTLNKNNNMYDASYEVDFWVLKST